MTLSRPIDISANGQALLLYIEKALLKVSPVCSGSMLLRVGSQQDVEWLGHWICPLRNNFNKDCMLSPKQTQESYILTSCLRVFISFCCFQYITKF